MQIRNNNSNNIDMNINHINNNSEIIELWLWEINGYWGECRGIKVKRSRYRAGEGVIEKGDLANFHYHGRSKRGMVILGVVSDPCFYYATNSKHFFPEFIPQPILTILELLPQTNVDIFGVNIKLYWYLKRFTTKQNRLF